MCRPVGGSREEACPGGHTGPPLRGVGSVQRSTEIGMKRRLVQRGGAEPAPYSGSDPDGRGGALPPPGFPGLMATAKGSVGADLCVGPWADPGRRACPGAHTGPPLRREGNIPEPTGSVQNAAFPGGAGRSPPPTVGTGAGRQRRGSAPARLSGVDGGYQRLCRGRPMCRPVSRSREDDVSGRTHRSAPTRGGAAFRSQQDRCKTRPSPAGRGGARPLQWGRSRTAGAGLCPRPAFRDRWRLQGTL